jgi:hypothetical protein
MRFDARRRGLEAVKGCTRVYLEAYTSILMVDKTKLVRGCWSLEAAAGLLGQRCGAACAARCSC